MYVHCLPYFKIYFPMRLGESFPYRGKKKKIFPFGIYLFFYPDCFQLLSGNSKFYCSTFHWRASKEFILLLKHLLWSSFAPFIVHLVRLRISKKNLLSKLLWFELSFWVLREPWGQIRLHILECFCCCYLLKKIFFKQVNIS